MKEKQVFQASSPLRWKTFQWLSRLVIFFLVLLIPIVWIAWKVDIKPRLPLFSQSHKKSSETIPRDFTRKEAAKYKGIAAFLKAKQHNDSVIAAEKKLVALKKRTKTEKIRAGFYVDWDPQAWFSLQTHINDLNTVIPEWFFIDSSTGKIVTQINSDTAAYNLMKKHNVKILPILSNTDASKSGNFSGELLDKVLRDQAKSEQLINDIVKYLLQYKLQGINLDFEELKESSIQPMNAFVKKLYERLHPLGMLVTQDVMPNDEDFNIKELAKYEDYIFLMAYDQHWDESVPGPVSDQKWIEKVTDEIAKKISPSKIVLALGGFGYDWPDGEDAESVTYQQAMSTARKFNSPVDFNNDSYNCSFSYTDNDSIDHKVFFVDAGGNFNAMRFADQYGTGGTALWRLGSEDERIWTFYIRDLSDEALAKQPFNFSSLSTLDIMTEKPDYYRQDGEVLDVVSNPQKGLIDIERDSADNLVSEENYRQLPTRYVLRRFGNVLKEDTVSKNVKITTTQFGKTITKDTVVKNIKITKRVVLTFDDGPDPEYTPRILDILKKEKVPAAFFVVGINAENHLPILKRIYREGFEIGNHSFTHPNMATVSAERAETEMEATRLLIEAATGRSTILFRAPYNADAEPSTLVELKPVERGKQDGYYTVGESIDPEDWNVESGVNADSIYDRIVRRYEADSTKGIILLHDAGGNREATVQALPRIIQYFKSHNVKFATISEILNLPKDAIMPPVHTDMIKFSGWASAVLYWIEKLLVGAFWLAIVLGLGRILFMGVLATIQYGRSKREKKLLAAFVQGTVSIIVPAYNEEINAIKTIENLLQQDYEDLEIVFVNDGSTDNTFEKVAGAFVNNDKVRVFTKANGGKASALNFGIANSTGDYLVCIDADTQLMPDAVGQLMKHFKDPAVGAVAGNVKVGNERSVLTKWQSIEYTTAQNFDRRAFDLVNCITVVPGAIGAFKREAIVKAGGFTSDTLAEDCDLTIRILRHGYRVRNCAEAIAITEAPETLKQFMKQRFRWNYGIMQSFWKNKDACFNPGYRSLGLVALPNILLFQVLTPIFAPIADLLFILSLIWNRHDPESMHQILFFYGLFLVVDVAVSLLAFAFEKENLYKLIWILPQRFAYRQLIYVVLFRSIRKAIKGETQGWGVLKRTGNVKLIGSNSFMNPH
jgi:cellulose synthase/poly-beta-1,6-N-acetylglucosamine synthase-like glycosyltransferase/spore germination protein YaaH/peptidoglycan/xylan/chitin deacetylase (PgdA/CDA1 family)